MTNVLSNPERLLANMDGSKREAIYLPSLDQQEIFIDLISDISTYLLDTRSIQGVYDEQKNLLSQAQSSKKKVQAVGQIIFKTMADLEKFYEDRKIEKAIDLVDIKRRINDFLKVLELKRE